MYKNKANATAPDLFTIHVDNKPITSMLCTVEVAKSVAKEVREYFDRYTVAKVTLKRTPVTTAALRYEVESGRTYLNGSRLSQKIWTSSRHFNVAQFTLQQYFRTN